VLTTFLPGFYTGSPKLSGSFKISGICPAFTGNKELIGAAKIIVSDQTDKAF